MTVHRMILYTFWSLKFYFVRSQHSFQNKFQIHELLSRTFHLCTKKSRKRIEFSRMLMIYVYDQLKRLQTILHTITIKRQTRLHILYIRSRLSYQMNSWHNHLLSKNKRVDLISYFNDKVDFKIKLCVDCKRNRILTI